MSKRRLKRAVTLAGVAVVYTTDTAIKDDHRTRDILLNSQLAPDQVDNPDGAGKILVMRSLRDDPLAALKNAGQIDHCQYTAGRHWQRAFELAQGAGLRGIDPAKDAVDGGQIAQSTLTEMQINGSDDISAARAQLGQEGESIVMDILARGLTLTQAAARRQYVTEAERRYIGRRFRECLDTLSWVFNYASCPQDRKM